MKIDYNVCVKLLKDVFPQENINKLLENYISGYFLIDDVRYLCYIELGIGEEHASYEDILSGISSSEKCKEILHDSMVNYIIKYGTDSLDKNTFNVNICNRIATTSKDSKMVYEKVKSIIDSKKYFEYRDASNCDTNLSTYSKYGIVYVTDDCYCFDKIAIDFLASKCNLSSKYFLKCIDFNTNRKYNVCSSVTVTNKDTGKKYRRKVFRIEV